MLTEIEQSILSKLAKETIKANIDNSEPPHIILENYSDALTSLGCCFVTLDLNDELRGCIGTLEPYQPLIEDVAEHAIAAAFRDPRFPPLSKKEYPNISLEISVLNTPTPMTFKNEQNLLEQIMEGKDGLILEDGNYRGTFLPAVWEGLPNKKDFWQQLKQKAGMPFDYWSDTLTVHRYGVQKFGGSVT